MRTIRSRHGPFHEQPRFDLSEIEAICTAELKATGLYPAAPGAVRIERFVEKRFGVTPEYEDLGQGVLGYTRFGAKGVEAIIVSREFESIGGNKAIERRLWTTLAHEAGHGLLHGHLFALGERPKGLFDDDIETPAILCRDVVGESAPAKRYDGRWWEFQANRAIGGLLMPRPLVAAAASEFLSSSGLLGLPVLSADRRQEAIRAMADVFDVNPIVARIRLEEIFPASEAIQPTL